MSIYEVKSGKKILVKYDGFEARVVRVLDKNEIIPGIKTIKCNCLKLGGASYR